MNKEFIPYDIALALKELGFDKECLACYYKDKTFAYHPDSDVFVDTPLYQQAFRWFREKYNLIGLIEGGYDNGKNIFTYVIWDDFKDNSVDVYYQTYEETEIACLKKLIEICRKLK